MKICKKCLKEKNESDFGHYKNKNANGEYYSYVKKTCKECCSKRSRECEEIRAGGDETMRLRQISKKSTKHRLRVKYGMSLDEMHSMLTDQNFKCKICEYPISEYVGRGGDRNSVACVDHNHETGVVRGILCHRCNAALGLLRDDIDVINRLKNYLLLGLS